MAEKKESEFDKLGRLIKEESDDIRTEIGGMRGEVHELRGEVHGLRDEMHQGFATINRRLDTIIYPNATRRTRI